MKNIKLMNILAAPEGIAGSGRTTRMWRSTSPPWMKSSMTTATSSPVWGTPVTDFRHQVRAPTWGLSRLWRDPRKILKSRKKRLTVSYPCDIISLALNEAAKQKALSQGKKTDARVVELADSLDSGSSVQYARAGSSPASRTKKDTTSSRVFLSLPVAPEPFPCYTEAKGEVTFHGTACPAILFDRCAGGEYFTSRRGPPCDPTHPQPPNGPVGGGTGGCSSLCGAVT